MLVFAVWLLLSGVTGLVSLGIPPMVFSALALVAGVLILAGR
jgi:hypothetical protein